MLIHMNFANQTVWAADCLDIMRGMNSDCIDLICLDPPFNSNANYAAPIGSQAAGAEFKDTWTLSDIDTEWINLIESKHPTLYRVLLAAMTDSDKSYLVYMAVRLLEMRRILKPTGSIYLHCDPTMSHYLKLVMDAIFGRGNFLNEIIWQRTTAHNDARRYGSVHDVLLYFTKSEEYTWNEIFTEYDDKYLKRFRYNDPDGREWTDGDLTAKGLSGGGYTYEYKGVTSLWRVPYETMKRLDLENRLHFTKSGGIRQKRYLDELPGRSLQDIISDIPPINSQAKERTGFPTQKPLALYRRIIEASSTEDDLVFDPFCGCATTCIAAQDLGRQWAGIDVPGKAIELTKMRLREELGLFANPIHRTDIPQRTDLGKLPRPATHKKALYGEQAGNCEGCGEHFQIQHLEVDHIIPRSKGGTDHIENLQLLCGSCNRIKGNRGMEYLKVKLQLN